MMAAEWRVQSNGPLPASRIEGRDSLLQTIEVELFQSRMERGLSNTATIANYLPLRILTSDEV